jgi:DegV family protein with EDD domain
MSLYPFTVSTDSTADLMPGFAEANDVWCVPLTFTVEKNGVFTEHKDNFKTLEEYSAFYQSLREGSYSRTAMLNLADHIEHFTKMAQNGVTDCVHFTISYGLSPTVDVAKQAAKEVQKHYPNFHLYPIESRSATVGQGILVKLAIKARNEGQSAEQVTQYLQEAKMRLQHLIVANDLYYLKRGGRVSAVSAAVGTMLSVKPYIVMNGAGKLIVESKFAGFRKAFTHIVDDMERFEVDEAEQIVVVHTDAPDKADELAQKIYERFGITPAIQVMGPVIGSHVGPGAVACAFLSKTPRT